MVVPMNSVPVFFFSSHCCRPFLGPLRARRFDSKPLLTHLVVFCPCLLQSGDESLNGQEGNLQLTISEDQEVGGEHGSSISRFSFILH